MAAEDTYTYEATIPHRPSLAQLGDANKQNDPKYPPDPITMPTAEEHNQFAHQIAGCSRMVPLATLHLTFSAGTPSVALVACMNSSAVAGDFTVVDNGVGDTTIWWLTGSGGTLPSTGAAPRVSQTEDVEVDRMRAFYTTVSSNPAVQVKTKLATVGTDTSVLIDII